MPLKIELIDNGLGAYLHAKGSLKAEDYYIPIMEHLSRPDEELKKIIYMITDYRAVTKIEINLGYVSKIAKKANAVSKINSDLIKASIATNDVVYGMIKMFGALAKFTGWTMSSFRNKKDADEWVQKKH